jgi:hypothetical protein
MGSLKGERPPSSAAGSFPDPIGRAGPFSYYSPSRAMMSGRLKWAGMPKKEGPCEGGLAFDVSPGSIAVVYPKSSFGTIMVKPGQYVISRTVAKFTAR